MHCVLLESYVWGVIAWLSGVLGCGIFLEMFKIIVHMDMDILGCERERERESLKWGGRAAFDFCDLEEGRSLGEIWGWELRIPERAL
jgi:hypothetical protein